MRPSLEGAQKLVMHEVDPLDLVKRSVKPRSDQRV
jgi:hypothetical protein